MSGVGSLLFGEFPNLLYPSEENHSFIQVRDREDLLDHLPCAKGRIVPYSVYSMKNTITASLKPRISASQY